MKKSLLWLLLTANIGFVCAGWWVNSGDLLKTGQTYDILYALGRLAGLLAVLSVLLQLILAGRTKWVERVFGLDRLFVAHGINGLAALVFIVAHPVLLITSTNMQGGKGWFREAISYITGSDDLMQAFFAVVLFVVAIAISIVMVKKYFRYEVWYFVHLTMYLAIILAFGHQIDFGGDFSGSGGSGPAMAVALTIYWYAIYTFVVANLVYFRFFKPAYDFYNHKFTVKNFTRETSSVVSLHISGKNMNKFKAKGGQFVIVRFLKKGMWTQAHPFSISKIFPDGSFRLSIKALGDFTGSLDEKLIGTSVVVDGPHGLFTAERAQKNEVVLIAGGIGITPMCSLIDDLKHRRKHVALLYANKNASDIPLRNELEKELKENVQHVMSDDPTWNGLKGRITPEIVEKCAKSPEQCDFYLCGPKGMMNSLRRDLNALGVPPEQVHYEKFALG